MFIKAMPIWVDHRTSYEKQNRTLVFKEELPSLDGVTLRIAAADFYRLTVNGEFVGWGPARTAKGYARVDEYELSALPAADKGINMIAIEVAGYYCKSICTVRQPSFLCAELIKDGEALAYTGRDFECFEAMQRVRKVERYSVQRHFLEVYDRRGEAFAPVTTVTVKGDLVYIPRGVPFASFGVCDTEEYAVRGTFTDGGEGSRDGCGEFGTGEKKVAYSFPPEREEDYGIFAPEEIEYKPYRYVGQLEKVKTAGAGRLPIKLSAGEWVMLDMKLIQCGFIRFSGEAEQECDIVLAFNELCDGDVFNFRRSNFEAVLEYILPAGRVSEESFEPYAYRHVAIFVKRGSLRLESLGCRTCERDMSTAIKRTFKTPELNDIYQSALRTFAHNAVDLFTDCPSRERSGWLCDSFFTARAEYFFFGETPIEDAFLENYRLYAYDGSYPEGVLPMCYPGDPHENGKFIPQWDMWYVLEVCEYLKYRRPDVDRELFVSSVFGVLGFLEGYENADGLLEALPSWNFIEWSDANSWTQDVNYPTNFLYAGMLDAVADVFDRPELAAKAAQVRKVAIAASFNGEVFADHALRVEDGSYVVQKHISEACQYYAILYGGVELDDERYAALAAYVKDGFASFDAGENKFCPINAFIGLYLRMNVLINMEDSRLMAENLKSFCLHMSRTTGTLWEYRDGVWGSLDHGFASYVALTVPFADSLESSDTKDENK